MATRKIELSNAQAKRIDALLDKGAFANEQDILNAALKVAEAKQARHDAKVNALVDAAQVGIDDIDSGRYHAFETPEELQAFVTRTFDDGVAQARTEKTQRKVPAQAA
jgi:antitoxin ParD1/3/4